LLKLTGDHTNSTWWFPDTGWASSFAVQSSNGTTAADDALNQAVHVSFSPVTVVSPHDGLGSVTQQDAFAFAATFGHREIGYSVSGADQTYTQQLFHSLSHATASTINDILDHAPQGTPLTITHNADLGHGIPDVHNENPLAHYFLHV